MHKSIKNKLYKQTNLNKEFDKRGAVMYHCHNKRISE